MKKLIVIIVALMMLCFTYNSQIGVSSAPDMDGQITADGLEAIVESRIVKLNSLGITEADEAVQEAIVGMYENYPLTVSDVLDMNVIDGAIFTMIGSGNYDYDTWEWTPGSDQIYAFDMEVFDISNMYSQFFQGIIPLLGEDVTITDIEEEAEAAVYEKGIGKITVRFNCNGNPYKYEAELFYDWFDPQIIDFVNMVLEKEGCAKRLWVTYDGGQGCIIFFNTKEWAKEFKKTMGYELLNTVQ